MGDIFNQAIHRFNNPVNLKKVINIIDEIEWTALDVDVKAEAFEGLLEKAASEGKKGAGQYFTPRVLIQSIVRLMKPDPRDSIDFKVCDPVCGSGGFLVSAYQWLLDETGGVFDRKEIKRIKTQTYYGQDLVPRPRRLALMNLFLQGLEPTIYTILKRGGRAAIVLPDNCLFEDKAGEVFKILMEDCNVHRVLRLPRGTFTPYSQGVKANVIFLQKGLPTENVWIFDARSNVPTVTKKERPLTKAYFEEFEQCYGDDPNGRAKRTDLGIEGRFRCFSLDEIKARDYKLDITWLKDESLEDADDLPEPDYLTSEAITELEAVVDSLKDILELIED